MKRTFKALAAMAAMLTFLGDDCSGVAVEDPTFRLWKSDTELAAWDVTTGSIRKAPTWDDADPGVEFVETPTEISQQLQNGSDCVKVTVMGYADESAGLTVKTSESFTVPQLTWESYSSYLPLTVVYDEDAGTTRPRAPLAIRKTGPGKVILSSITAESTTGCGPSVSGK